MDHAERARKWWLGRHFVSVPRHWQDDAAIAALTAQFAEADIAGYERGRAEEYSRTVQERERWDALLKQAERERNEWKRIAYAETKSNRCVWQERAEQAEAALAAERERSERLVAVLAEWRKQESAPDCVACCVLDAELGGPVKHIPDGEEG